VLLNTPPTATSEQAVSHQQQHQQQQPTRHRFTQLLPVTVTLLLLLPPSPFHKQQLPTSPNKMHSQLHAPDATPQNGCLFYGTHY
jgi:hypothetical protein